ncbi:hypothetical protein [Pseudomonas plecoglossicida]|uniref:hypothetical protein n=1 Tax=Pseudomonas plecoglossicida TaxID=70775 RepID=UPI00051D608E|nr:hypothetical protein [Pseudomonas plecoglossicida]KGK24275.1 hypothetical protein GT93_05210 [Pseudomonas plecoglossicida]
MSDEYEDTSDLGDLAAQITDTVGLADDVGLDTAVPNALADEVEDYQAMADRRDEHLATDDQQVDDEQVEQQPQGKRQQHVPLGALQEERRARQAAQEQVRQMQAQMAAQQAQMQQWQAQQQQAQQQVTVPDFSDDPEGHVKALAQQFEQRLNDMQGQHQQRQELEQVAQQINRDIAQVTPFIAQVEPAFRAAHPDYDDAREFVQANIRQQIAAANPGATPDQIAGVEAMAQLQFIAQCQANGVDPCAHVYQRAQQLGFQTQARTPRRSAPTSLSTLPASGKAPDQRGAPSASQIASMSNADFDAFFESMRVADAPRFGF